MTEYATFGMTVCVHFALIVYNTGVNDQQPIIRPASLLRALVRGFRDAYDHLGYVVAATFLSFLYVAVICTALLPVWRGAGGLVARLALLLLPILGAWFCAVGVFYYVRKAVYHERPSPAETITGMKLLRFPALLLFVVDMAITVVLAGDTAFFLLSPMTRKGLLFPALAVGCAYITMVWLMMAMYHLPLLVAQLGTESGPRPFVIIRKSFLLAADNPAFTVGLFLAIIAFTAVCAVSVFGMVVMCLGGIAFVLTHALRELYIKYGVVEEEAEIMNDEL